MKYLSRIKNWVSRLLGKSKPSDRERLKCSICGTAVPEGESSCPLCGSTDLISANDPGTSPARSLSRERATQHTEPAADESVTQLQRVRTNQILSNNPDAWTETKEGYEVSVDNDTRVVGSKQEAAQLLKESE